jgi:NAD+ kinase
VRVLIVPNSDNASAVTAARELADWLRAQSLEPMLLPEDAEAVGLGELALPPDGPPCELVVALGGDGTVLRAVHALDGEDVPVLGINLGRLGFLTGADAHEMTDAVSAALEGRVLIEPLSTLDVEVRGGTDPLPHRALNEAYIGRGGPGMRVVELSVAVNGRELSRFMCDGLIVATPTGSTAYALSVGGPFVAPSVRGNVLVSVGAHTLAQRAFVLGPDDVVDVTCPNPARADVTVSVDGITLPHAAFEAVRVRRGEREVRLVRLHDRDYYDVVRRKFLGG